MKFSQVFAQVLARSGAGAGPDGFRSLMARLGNPQNTYRIIHVAGTNGKGSVCSLCAQALQQDGKKTGLFVSPHLFSAQERISINGQNISKKDFARLCTQVMAAEEKPLNFFEILTAAALLYFKERQVDYAVLETGLGGRKDPTNVCKALVSVITSIGLDHCQLLGHTLAEIAREKAGIIKPGTTVFCPLLPEAALQEVKQKALQEKVPLHIVKDNDPFTLEQIDWRSGRMLLHKEAAQWPLHLMGEKQTQNACLVYAVCRFLGVGETSLQKAFARVRVPCRFEVLKQKEKIIVFDGAHNPQAVQELIKFWRRSPWASNAAVVCGFMKDKDYPSMLDTLSSCFDTLYLTCPRNPRAASLQEVKKVLSSLAPSKMPRVLAYSLPGRALRAAQKAKPVVLVTGSFYLAGYLRARKGLTEKSDCD